MIHTNFHSLNNFLHEWAHICKNIDNEKNAEKAIKTFLWFNNKVFFY
jgi:hypothetical protein